MTTPACRTRIGKSRAESTLTVISTWRRWSIRPDGYWAPTPFQLAADGYSQLLRWMRRHGRLVKVGVEGTGSYGAGLARYLAGVAVMEVIRPNRQTRRRRGKSDPTDAEAAARAALNGEADGLPKTADGAAEALRALRVARRSAMKACTQAANQIRDLIVTATEQLRARLGHLDTDERVAVCARFRPGTPSDPAEATRRSLRCLARRHVDLTADIDELDEAIGPLCAQANPALLSARGVRPDTASALIVAAGDNPDRMRSEASFAALCGASPVEASSGRTIRHRLNRGGNREANHALWRIVMVRLSHDKTTQAYFERRRTEGRSDKEIIRCLKRYAAREIYRLLTDPPAIPDGADLRRRRHQASLPLRVIAEALATWPHPHLPARTRPQTRRRSRQTIRHLARPSRSAELTLDNNRSVHRKRNAELRAGVCRVGAVFAERGLGAPTPGHQHDRSSSVVAVSACPLTGTPQAALNAVERRATVLSTCAQRALRPAPRGSCEADGSTLSGGCSSRRMRRIRRDRAAVTAGNTALCRDQKNRWHAAERGDPSAPTGGVAARGQPATLVRLSF
jgi:transposase